MKIKKRANYTAPNLPSELEQLAARITACPEDELIGVLQIFTKWEHPKGDLHQWIDVLNRFDDILKENQKHLRCKDVESADLTAPLSKESALLLCHIMRVSAILLDNCSFRQIYGSVQYIFDFLWSTNLDIVENALQLTLRFARRASLSNSRNAFKNFPKGRLWKLTLAEHVSSPQHLFPDFKSLISSKAHIPADWSGFQFQYYRRSVNTDLGISPSRPLSRDEGSTLEDPSRPRQGSIHDTAQKDDNEEGWKKIQISLDSLRKEGPENVYLKLVDSYKIPEEHKYQLLVQVMVAHYYPNLSRRRQFMRCRLLALACLGYISQDRELTKNLFDPFPETIQKLAGLLDNDSESPLSLKTVTLIAFEALLNNASGAPNLYGSYHSERHRYHQYLTALGATLNHGSIMGAMRDVINILETRTPTFEESEFGKAFVDLIDAILRNPLGSQSLQTAGMATLLTQVLTIENESAQPMVVQFCRPTLQCLGNSRTLLPIFPNATSLNPLIRRIERQVKQDIIAASETVEPRPGSDIYSISFTSWNTLQTFLNLINRAIKHSPSERIRNVVESPLIPSLKIIVDNLSRFGGKILGYSVQIMSALINSEPTSYPILHESQLPHAFLKTLQNPFPSVSEFIKYIPSTFDAICINPDGLKLIQESTAIEDYFRVFEQVEHCKVLNRDGTVQSLGVHTEELIRHHPVLKNKILDGIVGMMKALYAAACDDPLISVRQSTLRKIPSPSKEDETGTGSSAMDVESEAMGHSEPKDLDMEIEEHDLGSLNFITSMTNFIYGCTAHATPMIRDLLRGDNDSGGTNAVKLLLNFLEVPNLPYDFIDAAAGQHVKMLLELLAETNAEIIVESILSNLRRVVEEFMGDLDSNGAGVLELEKFAFQSNVSDEDTKRIQVLTRILYYVDILQQLYTSAMRNHHHSQQRQTSYYTSPFHTKDEFKRLLPALGLLHRDSLWQQLLLKKALPQNYKIAIEDIEAQRSDHYKQHGYRQDSITKSAFFEKYGFERTEPAFRNAEFIAYLLNSISSAIDPFFQGLARMLLPRRTSESSQRSTSIAVAMQLAEVLRNNLRCNDANTGSDSDDKLRYWIQMINSLSKVFRDEESSDQGLQTVVLQHFNKVGGLSVVLEILQMFGDELESFQPTDDLSEISIAQPPNDHQAVVFIGTLACLHFLEPISTSDAIVRSSYTAALTTKERNKEREDYFNPHQFLVETRLQILPVLRRLWELPALDQITPSLMKLIINLLSNILKADGEENNNPQNQVLNPLQHPFLQQQRPPPDEDSVTALAEMGFSRSASRLALARTGNSLPAAADYLASHPELAAIEDPSHGGNANGSSQRAVQSVSTEEPVRDPADPIGDENGAMPAAVVPEVSGEPLTAGELEIAGADSRGGPNSSELSERMEEESFEIDTSDEDEHLNQFEEATMHIDEETQSFESMLVDTPVIDERVSTDKGKGKEVEESPLHRLNSLRAKMKADLPGRVGEIFEKQPTMRFELVTLITNASTGEGREWKKDIVLQIIALLCSMEPDKYTTPTKGKAVAASAHVLGLLLNDHQFYKESKDSIQEYLDSFLSFLNIESERDSPWIAPIYLILEAFMKEDGRPPPVPPMQSLTVDDIEKFTDDGENKVEAHILESILDKSVGILSSKPLDKDVIDSSLRMLVRLTKKRELAGLFQAKDGLVKLLELIRNLSGTHASVVHAPAMLIIRHLVEDRDSILATMRHIMDQPPFRQHRAADIPLKDYVRWANSLILRDSQAFIEVTAECCKLSGFNSDSPFAPRISRNPVEEDSAFSGPENSTSASVHGEASKSTTSTSSELGISPTKRHPFELPHSSGVIQTLLSELLSCKQSAALDPTPSVTSLAGELSHTPHSSVDNVAAPSQSGMKSSIRKYIPEENPDYVYAIFLLRALTELFASYDNCKLEFVSYSKRGHVREVSTPSKPRSTMLNYLLNDLLPTGTPYHTSTPTPGDLELAKKKGLSLWAGKVIKALCQETTGKYSKRDRQHVLFNMRRFVVEGIQRAFKDTQNLSDQAESRYSRLAALAQLCQELLPNRDPRNSHMRQPPSAAEVKMTDEIAKLMFEKGFVAIFTNAVAEVELDFPKVHKVLRDILGPLKWLVAIVNRLAEKSEIGQIEPQSDLEEISVGSSVSDEEAAVPERDETPDLFRNSALGIMHGEVEGEPENSDDESEGAEEEYDGMDMEYDEEQTGTDVSEDVDMDETEVHMDTVAVEEEIDGDEDNDTDETGSTDSEDEDHDMEEESEDDIQEDEIGASEQDSIIDMIEEVIEEDEGNGEMGDDDDSWATDSNEEGLPPTQENGGDSDGSDDDGIPMPEPVLPPGVVEVDDATGAVQEDMDDAEGDQDEVVEEYDEEDGDEDEDDLAIDDGDQFIVGGFPGDPVGGLGRHRHHFLASGPGGFFGIVGRRGLNPAMPMPIRFPRRQTGRRSGFTQAPEPGIHPLMVNPDMPSSDSAIAPNDPTGRGAGLARSTLNQLLGLNGHAGIEFAMELLEQIQIRGAGVGGHLRVDIDFDGTRFSARRNLSSETAPTDALAAVSSLSVLTTVQRWQEEAQLLYSTSLSTVAESYIPRLIKALLPAAIEEEKARKEKEKREAEERAQKQREERATKEREAAEAKEKADADARQREEEQRLREEEAERERNRIATVANSEENEGDIHLMDTDEDVPTAMEGVEEAGSAERVSNGQTDGRSQIDSDSGVLPSSTQRVYATLRGAQVDITELGVDPEFLAALPDDMREEVLTNHIRERRAAVPPDQPSEISPEFLDALPTEIREELLQQEAMDRRRRERAAQRASQVRQNGGSTGPAELDPASFLATLEGPLRQAVLMEQDDETLSQLPPHFFAEAQQLRESASVRFGGGLGQIGMGGIHRLVNSQLESNHNTSARKQLQKRKDGIHLLEKAGVATLLRLVYLPNQPESLSEALVELCRNRQTRTEIVNLVLSILQDGSADVSAVERSFSQLSLRAKPVDHTVMSPSKPMGKYLDSATISRFAGEKSPSVVARQCLEMLNVLVNKNSSLPSYFLMEHEIYSVFKRVSSRKGKGKEVVTKGSRIPLNTLLGLLERSTILDMPASIDQFAELMSNVTRPLSLLAKKETSKATERTTEQVSDVAAPHGRVDNAEPPNEPTSRETETSADIDNSKESKPSEPLEQLVVSLETSKGARTLHPDVPDYNLQLLVKILTARDCSRKAFQNTMATMYNLTHLKGAAEVFGMELVSQAQRFGGLVQSELADLLSQFQMAEKVGHFKDIEVSGFSTPGSDQTKLLKIIKAIDYLFDKSIRKDNESAIAVSAKLDETGVADISTPKVTAAGLYSRLPFAQLWQILSQCLSVLHDKPDTWHFCQILLPVIESLLVVCKNVTGKEFERRPQNSRQTTPVTNDSLETLFFTFTEEHRKILNQMVRVNPSLMSGSFSVLVRNPKVLEFDNKRNYFNRKIRDKRGQHRHFHPISLSVRRTDVFLDSFRSLCFRNGEELKHARLNIKFQGEEGVDAGGLTREWYQILTRQMFDPNYALFIPVAADRTTFHPNRASYINEEHLQFFKFVGRIIGKALYDGRLLDCHFSRAVYKHILGRPIAVKDMETIDLDHYKALMWMLDNPIEGVITETFSIESEEYGVNTTIDLVPDGRNIPVTDENKNEYVRLVAEYRLQKSVKDQFKEFLQGFHDIIPAELVSIFNEQELELLISGLPDINVEDWKAHTNYSNYTASSPQIQWFWRAVRSFDAEEKAKLLQFATGTSKVPLNGFKDLEGMQGTTRFSIYKDFSSKERLPQSHTCFNQIDLPEYDSYEQLRKALLTAITEGTEGFGFA